MKTFFSFLLCKNTLIICSQNLKKRKEERRSNAIELKLIKRQFHYYGNVKLGYNYNALDVQNEMIGNSNAQDSFYNGPHKFIYDLNNVSLDLLPVAGFKGLSQKPIIFVDALALQHKFTIERLSANMERRFSGTQILPMIDDKPVKTAVAANFKDVVINNDKDTFIKFYAPWCGHCKRLQPIYTELAEILKYEEIIIVEMDVTKNAVPKGFNLYGYPTIYWLPKNAKHNPKPYNGAHDVENFLKYIARNSTKELKFFDRNGNPKKISL